MDWLSNSQVRDLADFLPTLQIFAALLGFLYSVIVRWKRRRDRAELYTHIEAALAAVVIPTAAYLIVGALVPEVLARLPGLRFYVGIVGLVALYIAFLRLGSVIPRQNTDATPS